MQRMFRVESGWNRHALAKLSYKIPELFKLIQRRMTNEGDTGCIWVVMTNE